MRNIVLIGGMGTGKTTLARALERGIPDMLHVEMSLYDVRIPLTLLQTTHPDLLSSPKAAYINTIMENDDVRLVNTSRKETDDYLGRIAATYGDTILGEIGLAVIGSHSPSLLDNVPGYASVAYLRERGFFVVGLHCAFDTQVERSLGRKKDIDPTDRASMEEQVSSSNACYQIEACLPLADIRYDTERRRSDSPRIVEEIIRLAQ